MEGKEDIDQQVWELFNEGMLVWGGKSLKVVEQLATFVDGVEETQSTRAMRS